MLAGKNRFHGHGSLRYVYRNGQVVRHHHTTMKWALNARRKNSRVAIVVSKKVHKGAVGRNRIRRRLYEAMRRNLPKLQYNADIVLIVSSAEILTWTATEVDASCRKILEEASLYKTTP